MGEGKVAGMNPFSCPVMTWFCFDSPNFKLAQSCMLAFWLFLKKDQMSRVYFRMKQSCRQDNPEGLSEICSFISKNFRMADSPVTTRTQLPRTQLPQFPDDDGTPPNRILTVIFTGSRSKLENPASNQSEVHGNGARSEWRSKRSHHELTKGIFFLFF